jgi:hypothetical protein
MFVKLMSKLYDEAEGAQAPDANERSEDKPGASYIWALVIASVIDEGTQGVIRQWSATQFSGIVRC